MLIDKEQCTSLWNPSGLQCENISSCTALKQGLSSLHLNSEAHQASRARYPVNRAVGPYLFSYHLCTLARVPTRLRLEGKSSHRK